MTFPEEIIMPVVFKVRIERADLQANPDVLFIFGDNEARTGLGGQAGQCRGEPNALGVATKRRPSMDEAAMWSDADFERCARIIDTDLRRAFEHARRGGTVVIPTAGIGTGLSQLPQRAPRLMDHIRQRVRELRVAHQRDLAPHPNADLPRSRDLER
jgi:hypothetical protein